MRTNKEQVGKGYALDWMFSQMLAQEKQYDAFVVFDADNLVHPEFLREMNNHLCKGEKVIQGYMDSKNPTDSWIAGTFSIAFWLINTCGTWPSTTSACPRPWAARACASPRKSSASTAGAATA